MTDSQRVGDDAFNDEMDALRDEYGGDSFAERSARIVASEQRLRKYDADCRRALQIAKAALISAAVLITAGILCAILLRSKFGVGLGVVLALLGVVPLRRSIGLWASVRQVVPVIRMLYRDGALTAGVIVSTSPLEFVSIAGMSNGEDEDEGRVAIKRVSAFEIPGISNAVGTRVVCVSCFGEGDDPAVWGDFMPRPLVWGTDDLALIETRARELREEEFARLDALVAAGWLPQNAGDLFWLTPSTAPLAVCGLVPVDLARKSPPPLPAALPPTPPPLPPR